MTTCFQRKLGQHLLDARAAFDGQAPGSYDAEEEGYVASILNALHQWCVASNVSWQGELRWAQRFFEQDMAESTVGPEASRIATLEELACPSCGHEDSFLVQAGVVFLMHADGTLRDRDEPMQWDEASRCACPQCNHTAAVGQFRKREIKGD